MLIVFPTYECTNPASGKGLLCSNCIYKERVAARKCAANQNIDFSLLCSIIDQAIEMGVKRFEFSGGGEPLEYSELDRLIERLSSLKNMDPELRFGVLTNGLQLSRDLSERMLSVFSYIRVSFSEGTQRREENRRLLNKNLRELLELASTDFIEPSIGLKTLLSQRNAESLIPMLEDIKRKLGPAFRRIDHIRVKSMRSPQTRVEPTQLQMFSFRNAFYDEIFTNAEHWPENIQVDLDLAYVKAGTFRCRLTPLFSVVDPSGALLACYNYLGAYERLCIGDLTTQKFSEIWGSQKHRSIEGNIEARTVCNAKNGCPCRFVEYQRILDGESRYEKTYVPPAVDGFL